MLNRTAFWASCAAFALSAGMATAEVVINRGNDTDPATLDHHRTSTVSEAQILRDLYSGLVVSSAAGETIPGTAESWTVSEDGLVYTFTLRENAKWSNGDPVVAGDFQFAFRRIMNPATAAGYASVLFPILNSEKAVKGEVPVEEIGVKVVDDRTLEITLNAPTPYFLELLTHQTGLPLHPATVEAAGDRFTQAGTLVTNGAYKLVSFQPNDKIVMAKNEHFYDAENVAIDTVNWIPFEDRAACMRRFEAGEVQICSDVAAEQIDYVKANLADELRISPYLGTYYLPVKGETADSKLKDPRVRQAISMVIDRDFLADQVWRGTMLPGYSLVPPGIANYVADAPMLPYMGEDILDREDAAKALLDEAGVAPGSLTVKLRFNTSENNKNTMAAVADALSTIGITGVLDEVEGATYFNYLREDGPYDIARAGWIGDYNDPQNFLFLLTSDVVFNYPRWNSPEYDALMAEAANTIDLEARGAILAKAEAMMLEQVPLIPILYYSSRALVSTKVSGFEDNLMNVHGSRWLSLAD